MLPVVEEAPLQGPFASSPLFNLVAGSVVVGPGPIPVVRPGAGLTDNALPGAEVPGDVVPIEGLPAAPAPAARAAPPLVTPPAPPPAANAELNAIASAAAKIVVAIFTFMTSPIRVTRNIRSLATGRSGLCGKIGRPRSLSLLNSRTRGS